MKTRYVNWHDAYGDEKEEWSYIGQDLMLDKYGEASEDNEEGLEDDDYYPMMNYAYPIEAFGELKDEKILRVCEETSCTVVYNNIEDTYYLALCGGVQDSQSIALAYMILYAVDGEKYGCIDWDMLEDVYIHGAVSVGDKQYSRILHELKRQFSVSIERMKIRLNTVNAEIEKLQK
jgi:hypothetical protein